MGLRFLAPESAAIALAVVLPLAAALLRERHARRLRARLASPEPRWRVRLATAPALVVVAALLALAAAQPVIDAEQTSRARDAELYVVVDVTRSMLAADGRSSPTRLQRARALAVEIRQQLADAPVGVASLTDRTLPHLFPTLDQAAFAGTLERAIGVERPPPSTVAVQATALAALAQMRTRGFFSPTVRRRMIIVLTDGETRPVVTERFRRSFRRAPAIRPLFVHIWGGDERIFTTRLPDPGYLPDRLSRQTMRTLARSAGGAAFSEDDASAAVAAARRFVARAPRASVTTGSTRTNLAPYLLGAVFLPLLLIARRNNV